MNKIQSWHEMFSTQLDKLTSEWHRASPSERVLLRAEVCAVFNALHKQKSSVERLHQEALQALDEAEDKLARVKAALETRAIDGTWEEVRTALEDS